MNFIILNYENSIFIWSNGFKFSLMFLLLISLVISEQTADLLPPFYPNDKNRIGFWDLGGSSHAYDDHIVLLPPMQFHKGSVWSSLPIPYGEWSIDFNLNLTIFDNFRNDDYDSGFSFWLIDSYGTDGQLFGGPNKFHGIGVCGSIVLDLTKDYPFLLRFRILQSNQTIINGIQYLPFTSFDLPSKPFTLRIQLNQTTISLLSIENDHPTTILSETIRVDLKNAWLGLTTLSNTNIFLIDLLHAKFNTIDYTKRLRRSKGTQFLSKQAGQFTPTHKSILRNPSFSFMKEQIKRFKELNGSISGQNEQTCLDVLKSCDEIAEVVDGTLSYSQLADFVRKTMIPYAQSWQKRTFKIVERVEETKQILSDAFNQTNAMIYIFNQTITEMTKKTDKKIYKLVELLETEDKNLFTDEPDTIHFSGILKNVIIFELFAVIIVVIVLSKCYNH